jgi:hypothetical protein
MAYARRKQSITKDYILSRITEEEIFSFYLNIDEIVEGKLYRSPLRDDRHPTCSFSYRGFRLRFRDWKEKGDKDCFDVVGSMYALDFGSTLDKIAYDFKLSEKPVVAELVEKLKRKSKLSTNYSGSSSVIQVKIQDFTRVDKAYLTQFGITRKITKKFKCYSVGKLWVNGKDVYYYKDTDPAIGYYFGRDLEGRELWKIYFYKRSTMRFISNTAKLNGWNQLPEKGSSLIITKSMKDVMVLTSWGIHSIAPQAESAIIPDDIIDLIYEKFSKVYSLFDFDYTGVCAANRLRKRKIIPLFLTDGRFGTHNYGSKDISDYVRDNSYDDGKILILTLIHETRTKRN